MSSSEQQRSARAGFKQEMHTRHIVMLALGGVIAVIVLSILLPILQFNTLVIG